MTGPLEKEFEAVTPMAEAVRRRARRSVVLWSVRWAITVALCVIFWKHEWVRWTLLLAAPLGLFTLYLAWRNAFVLPKRMEKLRARVQDVDRMAPDGDPSRDEE